MGGFEGFGGELLTSEGLLRELPACVKCEADFEEFGGELPACEEPCCEKFGFEEDLSSEELCFVFSGSVMPCLEVPGSNDGGTLEG